MPAWTLLAPAGNEPQTMTRLQLATEADGRLIARSLHDPPAFAAVFDRHWPAIYRFCTSRAGTAGEDLAAEVFRIAFDDRRRFDTRYDDAAPWLYGVATNVLRRWFRQAERSRRAAARSVPLDEHDPSDDALGRVEAEALGPRLAGALRTLAAIDRDALLLYAWAGAHVRGGGRGHGRLRRHRPLAPAPRPRPRPRTPGDPRRGGHVTEHDDLDWLAAEQPSTLPPDDDATADARTALLVHVRAERRAEVRPDPAPVARRAPERRWLRPSRVLALAAAAAVAIVAATAIPGSERVGGSLRVAAPPVEDAQAATLVRLATKVAAEPEPKGDATLVRRHHTFDDGKTMRGFDLYLDDGTYYYGSTMAELRQAIADDNDQGNGTQRAVAAAIAAPGRPAEEARMAMVNATYAEDNPLQEGKLQQDNRVWFGSMDALLAGAGNPDVRAGVLVLVATLEKVTVAEGERNGRQTLELANSDFTDGYVETLIVDAGTGVPVGFTGGVPGQVPGVTMVYDVDRVTTAKVAQG